jgi:hypothetical protein
MVDLVFVFSSNLAGRHGKGAVLWARQYRGAIYGQGEGFQGSSYAIPIRDRQLNALPLTQIEGHVRKFLAFARAHPEMRFQLTPIGCGLAGYAPRRSRPCSATRPATSSCLRNSPWRQEPISGRCRGSCVTGQGHAELLS